ncbi:hypothetical protein [Streptomyces sp. H39-S7]|uniref:hypothetical protein n=1 Tax=Streptomyces sp. H39-S7 TaxID=3004357 RepID=UPI0022B07A69|nr:hypothetical protein [Streptomyces sp. H39-S7]MCZ4126096.1 hypothetical protein [Streptomyces sp. H39-S7]
MTPNAKPDDGREPNVDERAVAKAEAEIYRHIQHLHDEGVVDLDAPARDIVDVLDRNYPLSNESAVARAGGYWLVGDQGWCDHLT